MSRNTLRAQTRKLRIELGLNPDSTGNHAVPPTPESDSSISDDSNVGDDDPNDDDFDPDAHGRERALAAQTGDHAMERSRCLRSSTQAAAKRADSLVKLCSGRTPQSSGVPQDVSPFLTVPRIQVTSPDDGDDGGPGDGDDKSSDEGDDDNDDDIYAKVARLEAAEKMRNKAIDYYRNVQALAGEDDRWLKA